MTLSLPERHRALAQYIIAKLPSTPSRIGIGTGQTMTAFMHVLATLPDQQRQIHQWVASSKASADLLNQLGISCIPLNQAGSLDIYYDSTDWIDPDRWHCLKGGGGAMTFEKVCAHAATQFHCLATSEKHHHDRSNQPIAIEVLPDATATVSRTLLAAQLTPRRRENILSDHGNAIIDIDGACQLALADYAHWLDSIPGIVATGIFCDQSPNLLTLIDDTGTITHQSRSPRIKPLAPHPIAKSE